GILPTDMSVVRCEYCGATFTIDKAETEDTRLHDELRRWLDSLVAIGAASGTVDAASRRFIFAERLFPALRLEVDRHLEAFDSLRQVSLCIFGQNAGSGVAGPTGERAPIVDSVALRRVLARVEAAEVRSFAVIPEDRFRLDELAFRATVVLRL